MNRNAENEDRVLGIAEDVKVLNVSIGCLQRWIAKTRIATIQ
jgi:hypothetical protein